MSTEEMRAELEAEGYHVSGIHLVYKDDITYDTIHNDNGLCAVEQAYAYLQERREFEALRALREAVEAISYSYTHDALQCDFCLEYAENDKGITHEDGCVYMNAMKYITADDESDSA